MDYSFFDFLTLIGSLGLFLYGMKIMSEGLQKVAGDKLRSILSVMTTNRVTGILTGVLITALVQSSSATTVMVVSFVNAGLMTLSQSIGVIMGANIGTTVTAQIIRLMDIESGSGSILTFFKPDFLAPVALIIGIILIMFIKKESLKNVGLIAMGFGILFIGLISMTDAGTQPAFPSSNWISFHSRMVLSLIFTLRPS